MRRFWVRVATTVALVAAAQSAPTATDVISIKEGTFVFQNGTGDLDIAGSKGFSFVSRVTVSGGGFNPYTQCQVPECPPGAVVSLEGRWIGLDAQGTATFKGRTYENVGGSSSDSSADIAFAGSVTMPPMSDGQVSVTAPFEFSGLFAYGLTGPEPQQALLAGGGRVTLELRPNVDGDSWELVHAQFSNSRRSSIADVATTDSASAPPPVRGYDEKAVADIDVLASTAAPRAQPVRSSPEGRVC